MVREQAKQGRGSMDAPGRDRKNTAEYVPTEKHTGLTGGCGEEAINECIYSRADRKRQSRLPEQALNGVKG